MNPQDLQEIRDWTLKQLELHHSNGTPSFPQEVEILERILILTTEVSLK